MPTFARSAALAFAAVMALSATTAPSARAQEKQACADAYEHAQQLRRDRRLRAARKALLSCAQATCPSATVTECAQWLREVDESLPTIVIEARDGRGNEIVDVRVSVDGELLTEHLDGSALAVDPGIHTFRFERAGSAPAETRLVMREGQKNRLVQQALEVPTEPAPAPAPAGASSGPPILPLVVGGLGVVALGSFAYFGISAKSELDDLRATCAPHCSTDDLDRARTKAALADVSLGIGVVALAVATVLFVTGSRHGAPKQSALMQSHF